MQNVQRKTQKARALSNLAFLLVDVLESAFIEANEKLHEEGLEFRHQERREFNLLLAHCRNLKRHISKCSGKTQEYYGNDSDRLYQTVKLLIDRCGEDDMKLFKFYNYIKSFPSHGCFDMDDSVFMGVK